MKIAIISDTHDNLANLKKAISFLEKEGVKILLHCGDVASIETLKEILINFPGKVYLSLGNADRDHSLPEKIDLLKSFVLKPDPQIEWGNEIKEVQFEDKKIAVTHFPILAKKMAKSQKYDFIFYGHTHYPSEKKLNRTKLVNPGNLAGLIFKATFALYDTEIDQLELKILDKLPPFKNTYEK